MLLHRYLSAGTAHGIYISSLSKCDGMLFPVRSAHQQSQGKHVAPQLHFPGALAMILSGMLLRNVNDGVIISGLVPSWSKQIRAAALAIIFLRSGLEIDLDVRSPSPSAPFCRCLAPHCWPSRACYPAGSSFRQLHTMSLMLSRVHIKKGASASLTSGMRRFCMR